MNIIVWSYVHVINIINVMVLCNNDCPLSPFSHMMNVPPGSLYSNLASLCSEVLTVDIHLSEFNLILVHN